MRALVVDDSRSMRLILGRLLKEVGFEIKEAGHGRDALDQLRAADPFDLALIDWNMPEMNGLELVQAIRADARFAGMKLMMVTTEAEASRVEAAMSAGANEYVFKPFTPDVLRTKLRAMGLTAA
jgi:two-component system, chemotaxis family, chemotaxis protein CheY